jgi:probable O-glycosylation ligase (exosortase A-associated)
MRDIVVALFILAFLPLALGSSFAAFLLWTWVGLVAIHSYLYGFMRSVPLAQIFALITLGLLLVPSMRGKAQYKSGGLVVIMGLIVFHGFLSAALAYPGMDRNWELFSNMVKTILLCLLMPLFLVNRRRVNLYVMLLAMGVCFHGMLDGLKYVSSAGSHNATGIQKFGDNNHYAMVLLMGMPFLIYIYRFSASRLMRLATAGVFIITFLAVLATNSRGALISVVAMGLWIILLGKRKIAGLAMAVVLATLVVQLAPAKWFDRMDTIKTAEKDDSFMGRVTAWKRASAIALENPVFGGGYHAGQEPSIYEEFRYKQGLLGFAETPDTGYAAASHSIYFEVLGDLGFVGFFLFIAAIISAFHNWWRIRRLAASRPHELGWALELANMGGASMVVFVVGGAALSAAYFELPYYVMMLMQVLWTTVKYPQEIDQSALEKA